MTAPQLESRGAAAACCSCCAARDGSGAREGHAALYMLSPIMPQ